MASQKEVSLLRTIESQKEQLSRYETRMKDLVRAHKGLLKEKDALQATVTALSCTAGSVADTGTRPASSITTNTTGGTDHENTCHQTLPANGVEGVQAQVETLTTSLQTMLREKGRMEASFVADRKTLRAELDTCHSELESCRQELSQTRANLLKIQTDRDSESEHFNTMLREVQQLLMDERRSTASLSDQCAQQQLRLQQLAAADQAAAQVQDCAARWQHTAEDLDKRLAEREARVSQLEQQISQLSLSVGRHEQQSAADKSAIAQLKERLLLQLDEQQQQQRRQSHDPAVGPSLASRDHQSADLEHSCEQLRAMANTARQLVDEWPVEGARLLEPFMELVCQVDGADWRSECAELKQKLAVCQASLAARLHRQSSLASDQCSTEQDSSCELQQLRQQLSQALARLKRTCEERDAADRHLKQQQQLAEQNLAELRCAQRAELASLAATQREQLAQLEQQLTSQRLRLSDQLAECEAELSELRRRVGTSSASSAGGAADTAPTLHHISFTKNEANILHYVEEAARKDVEIGSLRRAKNQLEASVRRLESRMVDREEALNDHIEFLKERIQRLERNVSREGANLEYIKNVVVRYLLTSDVTQRAHMLNAIGSALRFSDDELRQSRRTLSASWWPAVGL